MLGDARSSDEELVFNHELGEKRGESTEQVFMQPKP
jgi:hypothetical protein